MQICALEVPARFGDPAGQLAAIRAALADAEPADLVLLPECALTGYVSPDLSFDLRPFAEPLEGPTLDAYRDLAGAHGTHLGGSLVEEEDDVCFNTFVVVDPAGELRAHYRKRHPWYPERWASRGTLPYPRMEIAGLKLALAVCFDVNFLPREALDLLAWADVLLFPSAWADRGEQDLRAGIFDALVQRFGLTVVNANWGHGQPPLAGQGRSRIVGPGLDVEARGLPGAVARVQAEIKPRAR